MGRGAGDYVLSRVVIGRNTAPESPRNCFRRIMPEKSERLLKEKKKNKKKRRCFKRFSQISRPELRETSFKIRIRSSNLIY